MGGRLVVNIAFTRAELLAVTNTQNSSLEG